MTGDSADILQRIKSLIPNRWFAWIAPVRDAVLGALSDQMAWCYSLITYARLQTRLATATDIWLDVFSFDYLGRHLPRNGMSDDLYRARIRATILQERVTRAGMLNAIKQLTGNSPIIFEPWNTGDTGVYGGNTFAYGAAGAWGSLQLPCQAFLTVTRSAYSGVPNVAGYMPNDGWNGEDQVNSSISNNDSTIVNSNPLLNGYARCHKSHSTGKFYFEFVLSNFSGGGQIGVADESTGFTSYIGTTGTSMSLGFGASWRKSINNIASTFSTGISFANNDIMNYAIDFDAGKIWVGKNGVWYNSGNPATGANPTDTFPPNPTLFVAGDFLNVSITANLLSSQFSYTPPSGFAAWSSSAAALGGYSSGAIEYVGSSIVQEGITDDIIYDTIETTRPTGTICWTRIN